MAAKRYRLHYAFLTEYTNHAPHKRCFHTPNGAVTYLTDIAAIAPIVFASITRIPDRTDEPALLYWKHHRIWSDSQMHGEY